MNNNFTSVSWLRFLSITFAVAVALSALLLTLGYGVTSLPSDNKTTVTLYGLGAYALVMLVGFASSRRIKSQAKGVIVPILIWLLILVLMGLLHGEYSSLLNILSFTLPVISGYFAFTKAEKYL